MTEEDKMLVEYALAIKRYCKNMPGFDCKTCIFSNDKLTNGNCGLRALSEKITNYKIQEDAISSEDKVAKAYFYILYDHCMNISNCEKCVFYGGKCKLRLMPPEDWRNLGE